MVFSPNALKLAGSLEKARTQEDEWTCARKHKWPLSAITGYILKCWYGDIVELQLGKLKDLIL